MVTESEEDNEVDKIKEEYDDIFHGIGKFSDLELDFQGGNH